MATMGIDEAVKAAHLEDVVKDAAQLKATVTEAVEEGFKSALRAVRQGREQAAGAMEDAKDAVKRNPIEAAGIAFLSGLVLGGLAVWIAARGMND